jgi:hypothetical protein
MSKLPAFDPVSIAVMNFGILLATVLALTTDRFCQQTRSSIDARTSGLRIGSPSWLSQVKGRQARVRARLAEDCEDQHLAERLRLMAANLAVKADEIEELPTECRCLWHTLDSAALPYRFNPWVSVSVKLSGRWDPPA